MDDAGAVHEADAGDDLGEEEADPDVVHLVEELLQEVVAQRLPEHALHHEDGATAAPAVRVEEGGEQSGEGRGSSSSQFRIFFLPRDSTIKSDIRTLFVQTKMPHLNSI